MSKTARQMMMVDEEGRERKKEDDGRKMQNMVQYFLSYIKLYWDETHIKIFRNLNKLKSLEIIR